jgi:putative transposase
MDFVHDQLVNGRRFKCLTMTDPCSKEVSVIEAWRREYNEERTHSAIGDVTPTEFIQHHQDRSQATQESTSLA